MLTRETRHLTTGGISMAQGVKIDTVRSSSSGTPGRSLNSARQQHFILDSPSGPNEAVTNEGIRSDAEPNRFQCINVSFALRGVSQGQADELVEVWKSR